MKIFKCWSLELICLDDNLEMLNRFSQFCIKRIIILDKDRFDEINLLIIQLCL